MVDILAAGYVSVVRGSLRQQQRALFVSVGRACRGAMRIPHGTVLTDWCRTRGQTKAGERERMHSLL